MANEIQPSYIRLHERGLLTGRVKQALALLENCRICPRECGVNRINNETGVCQTGRWATVSSFGPHFGEEDPLVGRNGSGTIFIANCNLLCIFCQNYDISHEGEGQSARPEMIAGAMIQLQELGCHNINFVTPTHVAPQLLEALVPAVEAGLKIPLVYNSGGYDSVETLKLLDGVFDIYMPDLKFNNKETGNKYCGVSDYPKGPKRRLRKCTGRPVI